MMKVIVTHKSNSISFEVEKNLPEHEAFEVVRAFTVSALEELPDPLVYSLAGGPESFRLQGPKDWKEGLQNHFHKTVICLNVVEPPTDSDGESDSYVLLTQDGSESKAEPKSAGSVEQESPAVQEEKVVEVEEDEEPVIEDAEEDLLDKQVEPGQVPEPEQVQEDVEEEQEDLSPASMKRRIMQFIVEIGSEAVQNIVAVVHSLVSEGANLGDAIRTAMETSDKAANHPLTKDLLAIMDVYVQKFNNCNWQPMLAQFNVEHIVALIPGIVDALTRSLEGAEQVELNMAPLMSQFCPMLRGMCQNIPEGQERVFQANPQNPFAVFEEARQNLQAEANTQVVHHGVVCDGCEMSPIVGVRYKSTLRPDYDLCEECEKKHDPADPLIKIKTPLDDMDPLPGLSEFRRAAVGGRPGRGHPCRWRRGRGRGRGRGCRMMKRMFENMKKCAEGSNGKCAWKNSCAKNWCKPQSRRDEGSDQVAQKKEEMRCKKQEIKEQKREMKSKKQELKCLKKEMKKLKKEAKAAQKSSAPFASCVVGHLDSEETSVQTAGSCVLHQWKVKNIGTQTWVGDVLAVFHKGNESVVADGFEVLDVGEVQPGHVCYLPIMINVPSVPGTYTVVYRMANGKGHKFGEPLRCVIEVEDEVALPTYEEVASSPAPSSPLSTVPGSIPQTINDVPEFVEPEAEEEVVEAAPAEPFAFATELQQLKDMGFMNDEETLKSVLVVTKGDLGQAISALM